MTQLRRKADNPKHWRKKFRLLSPSERDHLKYLELMGKLNEETALPDLQGQDAEDDGMGAGSGVKSRCVALKAA
jgi:hypothetical protein